jgi:hypothetical protein
VDKQEMAAELKSWGDRWGSWIGPKGDEARYKRMAECSYAGAAALLAEAEAREASVPTAAEVIAAAEKALELMSGIQPGYEEVNHATECCCNFCENNSLLSKIEDAIAAIAKLKEAQNA